MPIGNILASTVFRQAGLIALAIFVGGMLVLVWFAAEVEALQTAASARYMSHEAEAIAREAPEAALRDIASHYGAGLHRESLASLFAAGGQRLAGSILAVPPDLRRDGLPHPVTARTAPDGVPNDTQLVALAAPLSGGRTLVLAHSLREVQDRQAQLRRAILLGLAPVSALGLLVGAAAGWRSVRRVNDLTERLERVMRGALAERLPGRGTRDAFDQLAAAVNRTLDEVQRLLEEVRNVGNAMAHDLRTPLAHVQARLEAARARLDDHDDTAAALDIAIHDLDHVFAVMTALLRIGQIEGGLRTAGFAPVDMAELAESAIELYDPLAEARGIRLVAQIEPGACVTGDRELLFGAVANLLDNAIKFSPENGHVVISCATGPAGVCLAISDQGPGIPAPDRARVLERFHRLPGARQVPGHGLGLSLVASVVKLHRFHMAFRDAGPGLRAELRAWPLPMESTQAAAMP